MVLAEDEAADGVVLRATIWANDQRRVLAQQRDASNGSGGQAHEERDAIRALGDGDDADDVELFAAAVSWLKCRCEKTDAAENSRSKGPSPLKIVLSVSALILDRHPGKLFVCNGPGVAFLAGPCLRRFARDALMASCLVATALHKFSLSMECDMLAGSEHVLKLLEAAVSTLGNVTQLDPTLLADSERVWAPQFGSCLRLLGRRSQEHRSLSSRLRDGSFARQPDGRLNVPVLMLTGLVLMIISMVTWWVFRKIEHQGFHGIIESASNLTTGDFLGKAVPAVLLFTYVVRHKSARKKKSGFQARKLSQLMTDNVLLALFSDDD